MGDQLQPADQETPGKDEKEFLRTAYAEAGSNFRKLTEIRFQLTALLPLGTGLAVSTKVASDNEGFALFGAGVTTASRFGFTTSETTKTTTSSSPRRRASNVSSASSVDRSTRVPRLGGS